MKRIRTAQELYNEILKSFYFGAYKKGDRFITHQEARETYSLSKDTIARAYAMLRNNGFIYTNGSNGTVVTFDVNNSEHVAKVPLEWPKPMPEDTIPYEVAMRLHAHSLYTGLTHSSKEQLQLCKQRVQDILTYAQNGCPHYERVYEFWMCVISSLDNELLSSITNHFISRFLYLLPPALLSSKQQQLISASALEYYEFLLEAIDRREFEAFSAKFERHYHNYYQYGGVVFSKLEDGELFKEQTLYGKLLDDIYVKILSRELQKGDFLPTTTVFCETYGVSTTTVNRVYSILAELGFISRHVRSGTKLIAEPDDPEILGILEKIAETYKRDWKNAIDVLFLIHSVLSRRLTITPDIIQQMKEELMIQYNLFENFSTPYFPSAVLLSPLIFNLPAGILHKYYVLLSDSLNKVVTLCTFLVQRNEEQGKEIYQLMCDALDALEYGDQMSFADLSECVMHKNVKLLTDDYTNVISNISKQKTKHQ